MPKLDLGYGEDVINNDNPQNLNNEPVSQDDEDLDDKSKENEQDDKSDVDKVDENGNDKKDDKKDDKDDKVNYYTVKDFEENEEFEYEGNVYVFKEGQLYDKDGNIFKDKNSIDEWLKQFSKEEETDNDDITIENLIKELDVNIVDENDTPVEFENSLSGVVSLINTITEQSKQEHYEEAINALYEKYPFIEDVINYYVANGNSIEGINDIPNYSKIEFDADNEEQLENIIRMAWKKDNRKGDVSSYIDYLKTSGTLSNVAKEELDALKQFEKEEKERIAKEAKEAEDNKIKEMETYWNNVKSIIDKKEIAGYKIPDNIIINKDGKKISATPKDFFNYIYKVDKDGYSRYMRDLQNLDSTARMNDELLRAYLTFTGGDYKSLVNMAINKENIKRLKLSTNNKGARKQTQFVNKENKTNKIDLGY